MIVVTLRIGLRVDAADSTRRKRQLLQAMVEKLHRHFNVSVAWAEGKAEADAWILAAAVSRERREAIETLERVAEAIAAHPRAKVLELDITEV